jgi:hypothetical protein
MPRNKYKDLEYADKTSDEYKKAVEELVEIAVTIPDTSTYKAEDEFEHFLSDVHIKSGTTLVPAFIIYYEFLLWSGVVDNPSEEPKYLYEEFFLKFAKRFKGKRRAQGKVYQVGKDPFEKYHKKTDEELKFYKEFTFKYTSKIMRPGKIQQRSRIDRNEKEVEEEGFFQEAEEDSQTE